MEVVHEEDIYHHELNQIYQTNADFHLKGIVNQKMAIWQQQLMAKNVADQAVKLPILVPSNYETSPVIGQWLDTPSNPDGISEKQHNGNGPPVGKGHFCVCLRDKQEEEAF